METYLKPLTEPASYIYLSGIFLIIFGATIGITPPNSRKTLHTSLAIPLFIALGLVNIFRSFDYLSGIGSFVKINAFLQTVAILCATELGRRNIENAFSKKKFSAWWYIPFILFLFYLSYEYDVTNRLIRRIIILISKLFAIVVTIKATKILPNFDRNTIRSAFAVAFLGAIIQFILDLNFATVTDGHYNPLPQEFIYLYYTETTLALVISSLILTRRYIYEKSQRLHIPNTLSLMSPIVVFITSIVIALVVLIGSNLINEQEKKQQNLESLSYNLHIKNAINKRLDAAIFSARLISENPSVSRYLSNPREGIKNALKKFLISFNRENPNFVVYLMDSNGNVLISSEEHSDSENKNFSSRDFFIDGIKGFPKLTINKEGNQRKNGLELFADSPVFSSDGTTIIGVVALKVEITDLDTLIKLNRYPTMVIDTKNDGKIIVSNDKAFLNQKCGNIKEFVDQGIQDITKIPILSAITNQSAFFSLASIENLDWCVLSLSNISQSATTQIWLLSLAMLINFILYIVLYGIAYNSEKLKTIEAAQSNFQLIFNHTPDPICVISEENSQILALNKSMQKTFGYEKDMVGEKLDDMIITTNKLKYNIPTSQDVVISECKFKKANNEEFIAEVTASFIEYGEHEALLLNIHDISMFKEIEEKLTEANQVKSRLLSNANHELRTPMTAIIGLSELAVSICNNSNQRQIIELLRIASKSLMSLINDIFNITEIQSGKFKINTSIFKLTNLIDEVYEYTSFLARKANKNLVFRKTTSLPEYIKADSDHLRQTLISVLDYTSEICVNNNTLVNIEFIEKTNNTGFLDFIISGIDPEKREEINKGIANEIDYVNPYQASSTRKFASGISLHSLIINQMNGSIVLESQEKIPGTLSLKISLPVEVIDKKSFNEDEISDNTFFYYKGRPLKLLVADDNDVNLFLVESIITRFKGECQTVRDGIEVIDSLKENEFDGILLDIQMPRLDGMETLKQIRKMSGDISRIPIIAISAFASEEEKKKIIEAGAQQYLGKPYFPKDLHKAISSVFKLDKEIPETVKTQKASEETKSIPSEKNMNNTNNNQESFITNLKRIDYPDFKVRINPDSKSILKLEEIYNRRANILDIDVDNSINNNDSVKLRETAHSIKGLVGMMSAKESWEIAKEIERLASEGKMQEAISRIGELRLHLSEISEDLKIIKNHLI